MLVVAVKLIKKLVIIEKKSLFYGQVSKRTLTKAKILEQIFRKKFEDTFISFNLTLTLYLYDSQFIRKKNNSQTGEFWI